MTRKLSVILSITVIVALGAASALAAGGAKINLRKVGDLGKVVVNSKGRTLYLFEKDTNGKSHCSGTCAMAWVPVTTHGKPAAGKGVKASLLGTVKRSDGTTQVTYNKHPLYTFVQDTKAGTATGEGSKAFGASWYVVNAAGKKIDKS